MKFKAIIFLISSATILNLHKTLSNVTKRELKCENEGCYEVIKTFAQLLEEKINETDKVSFSTDFLMSLWEILKLKFLYKMLKTPHKD